MRQIYMVSDYIWRAVEKEKNEGDFFIYTICMLVPVMFFAAEVILTMGFIFNVLNKGKRIYMRSDVMIRGIKKFYSNGHKLGISCINREDEVYAATFNNDQVKLIDSLLGSVSVHPVSETEGNSLESYESIPDGKKRIRLSTSVLHMQMIDTQMAVQLLTISMWVAVLMEVYAAFDIGQKYAGTMSILIITTVLWSYIIKFLIGLAWMRIMVPILVNGIHSTLQRNGVVFAWKYVGRSDNQKWRSFLWMASDKDKRIEKWMNNPEFGVQYGHAVSAIDDCYKSMVLLMSTIANLTSAYILEATVSIMLVFVKKNGINISSTTVVGLITLVISTKVTLSVLIIGHLISATNSVYRSHALVAESNEGMSIVDDNDIREYLWGKNDMLHLIRKSLTCMVNPPKTFTRMDTRGEGAWCVKFCAKDEEGRITYCTTNSTVAGAFPNIRSISQNTLARGSSV